MHAHPYFPFPPQVAVDAALAALTASAERSDSTSAGDDPDTLLALACQVHPLLPPTRPLLLLPEAAAAADGSTAAA